MAYTVCECCNGASFILTQTMLQKRMQPDSRGTIVSFQGVTFGLGIGIHKVLVGKLYDGWSHKGAFAIVFCEVAVYWVSLGFFIVYRWMK